MNSYDSVLQSVLTDTEKPDDAKHRLEFGDTTLKGLVTFSAYFTLKAYSHFYEVFDGAPI